MTRFKLGFGNRTILEQIAICRRVADGIARLPVEQREALTRHPVADSVVAAAAAHGEVETMKTALKAALRRRDAKVRAMRDCANDAGLAIFSDTSGDPAALLAAGLDLEKARQPVGQPAAPTQLRASATEFEGRVRLRWKRPIRRCVFIIEMTTDPAALTGWRQVAVSGNRQSCEVAGLESGRKGWFRVAATNAHGQGPWSQPVCARAK